jgi:hypothetical protein
MLGLAVSARDKYNKQLEDKKIEAGYAYLQAYHEYQRSVVLYGALSQQTNIAFDSLTVAQRKYNRLADKMFK